MLISLPIIYLEIYIIVLVNFLIVHKHADVVLVHTKRKDPKQILDWRVSSPIRFKL